MAGAVQEWGIAAFGASAAIFSGLFSIWAVRRDRDKDRHEASEKRLDKHAVEIRHTQKSTNTTPFFDGEL